MSFLDKEQYDYTIKLLKQKFDEKADKATIENFGDVVNYNVSENINSTIAEQNKIPTVQAVKNYVDNNDVKVTSVDGHYKPCGGSTISAKNGELTELTNVDGVQVITGITKDEAGHITGIVSKALKASGTVDELGYVPMDSALKGAINGVAELDSSGKVPVSQLPGYTDNLVEVETKNDLPATGQSGVIYVDKSNNAIYRWSGTRYVEINSSLTLGTVTGTALDGKIGYDHIQNTNVHITPQEREKWNNKADATLASKTDNGLMSSNDKEKLDKIDLDNITSAIKTIKVNNQALPVTNQSVNISITDKSLSAEENGSSKSLVTTGEKFEWNDKADKATKVDTLGSISNAKPIAEINSSGKIIYNEDVKAYAYHYNENDYGGIVLGSSSDEHSAYGVISIYDKNGNYAVIKTPDELQKTDKESQVTFTLPDSTGKIALDSEATTTQKGLLSAEDKVKLNSLGSAASKNVDTTISNNTTSTNLPTSLAVKNFIESKGYKTTDTTYENKPAASGGTAVSLVTTGDKYIWNNKVNSPIESSYNIKIADAKPLVYMNSNQAEYTNRIKVYGRTYNDKQLSGLVIGETGTGKSTYGVLCICDDSGNYASLKTPTTLTSNVELILPSKAGVLALDSDKMDKVNPTGTGSLQVGTKTHALGTNSAAFGENTIVTGRGSVAFGNGKAVTSSDLAAIENGTFSSNSWYDYVNYNTYSIVKGNYSSTFGYGNYIIGNHSFSAGQSNYIEGNYSAAFGKGNYVDHDYQFCIGTGCDTSDKNKTFFIGYTAGTSQHNVFTVDRDGNVNAAGEYSSDGGDYAEMFEWEDGNLNNEDRIGRFVTLNGNKISYANSNSDYILGVVTGNATLIGNSCSERWQGAYLLDDYNRKIYEEVEEKTLDEDGNEIATTNWMPKINPEYDADKEYISRGKRPEWDKIGMLGVIPVKQDGTAQVNGYVTVGKDGIATACDIKEKNAYRVLKVKNNNVIEILFK